MELDLVLSSVRQTLADRSALLALREQLETARCQTLPPVVPNPPATTEHPQDATGDEIRFDDPAEAGLDLEIRFFDEDEEDTVDLAENIIISQSDFEDPVADLDETEIEVRVDGDPLEAIEDNLTRIDALRRQQLALTRQLQNETSQWAQDRQHVLDALDQQIDDASEDDGTEASLQGQLGRERADLADAQARAAKLRDRLIRLFWPARSEASRASRLRGSIDELGRQLKAARDGHKAVVDWLTDQRSEAAREWLARRDEDLLPRFRRQWDGIADELDRTYSTTARVLIPQALATYDGELEAAAATLAGWHPAWDDPYWASLDVHALCARSAVPNPGLRVGTLVCDFRTPVIPAVIDPVGQGRHVLVTGVPVSRNRLLKELLLRLLLAFPVGLAQLVLIDGEELGRRLGTFAARLSPDIACGQVFDQEREIADQLAAVRERISTITQTVLIEHDTLADYNASNPEIPTAYQFIAISNFPKGLTADALGALESILKNGPTAGVFVLAALSEDFEDLGDVNVDLLLKDGYQLAATDGTLTWNSEYLGDYGVCSDEAIAETEATQLLQMVNHAWEENAPVVPYERIRASLRARWTEDTVDRCWAPVGLTFAGKLQVIEFSDDTVHGLIGGRTRSGKTVLLHDIICGLAQNHAPDDLEMVLLDFKGTEFSVYARNGLPHASIVAVDCDAEAGQNIIRSLVQEKDRRRQLFDAADVENYRRYRMKGNLIPQILLIIDEIQQLTQAGDSRMEQSIERDLVDLLKQGGGLGIHVLVGTQSPSNVLSRGMLQQMPMRICLKADPEVSRLVLGEGNDAASVLRRRGEAVYNAHNGHRDANVLMRSALLEREQIAALVQEMRAQCAVRGAERPLLYFDGRTRKKLMDDPSVQQRLSAAHDPELPETVLLPVGESMQIKDPAVIELSRKPLFGNVLMLAEKEEPLHALWLNCIAAACTALPAYAGHFYTVDLVGRNSEGRGLVQGFARMPQDFRFATTSATAAPFLEEIAAVVAERKETVRQGAEPGGPIFLAIFALESFGDVRAADRYSKPKPREQLEAILKDGPAVGVHAIIAGQSLLKGTVITPDEFGTRVCFQVTDEDSRGMFETDVATKLGSDDAKVRAVLWRKDAGLNRIEKFKPYLGIAESDLCQLADALASRAEPEKPA